MKTTILGTLALGLLLGSSAEAATFTFNTDPFAGSTALTDPGRQIVGGEPSITFDPANDVFVFDSSIFGLTDPLSFASGPTALLPTGGAEVVILQEFGPPMAAGIAASAIAGQFTSPGPGVFVYFNTGLGMPRLVYSPNLDDGTSDLKILARMTNLNAQSMSQFSAGNFAVDTVAVPEPATLILFGLAGLAAVRRRVR